MDMKKIAEDSDLTKDIPNKEWTYYTTTFKIPYWMGQKLQKVASRKHLDGMNKVVEISCLNYFFKEKRRNEHNAKLLQLEAEGKITAVEKEELWLS